MKSNIVIGIMSVMLTTCISMAEVDIKKDASETRLVAIFIKNHAGKELDKSMGAFEDLVIGGVTDLGFRVMSREDVINSVSSFSKEKSKKSVSGDELDKLLDNNTSATRLAQNMGADYLLIVSMATIGSDVKKLNRPDLDIDMQVTDYKLRTVYKILDASMGDSLSAGNVLSTKRVQQSKDLSQSIDVVNELLADAASQIVSKLELKGSAAAVPMARSKKDMVDFDIICSMQDLTVPEVTKDKDGEYILSGNRYKMKALAVAVELDGMLIGSAPGTFRAYPGIHKLKLSREGFKDWTRTVSIHKDQRLNVALMLTDEGRAYWLNMAEFFSKLKRDARITEADAAILEGVAEKMRNSGMKVDKKIDIKVNTKKPPVIYRTNVDHQTVTGSIWP